MGIPRLFLRIGISTNRLIPDEAEAEEDFLLPKTLTCCPEMNLSTEKPLRGPSSKVSMVQATVESSKKVSSSAFKKLDP